MEPLAVSVMAVDVSKSVVQEGIGAGLGLELGGGGSGAVPVGPTVGWDPVLVVAPTTVVVPVPVPEPLGGTLLSTTDIVDVDVDVVVSIEVDVPDAGPLCEPEADGGDGAGPVGGTTTMVAEVTPPFVGNP